VAVLLDWIGFFASSTGGGKHRLVAVEHQEREENGDQNTLFPYLSGNRIEPRAAERMTRAQPSDRQQRSAKRAMSLKRFDGIGGAGRQETARPSKERG
jgi:hypothetical protein